MVRAIVQDDAADDALAQRLVSHFAEVTASEQLSALAAAAPAPLRALWRAGAAWSLLPRAQSLGVFGFNLIAPSRLRETTTEIFGDAEERAAWAARHGGGGGGGGGAAGSCAGADWCAFAIFSEFDALFVCLAPHTDAGAGACRHVVNNCDEENDVPGGVPAVLAALADAVEAREARGGEPAALAAAPLAALCRPLQRMREAILSA